ncbi:MAG: acyl carrier protein [Clostridiales bacterium]|nr:acyl carrier protein [Candidatus Apopatousia equi]
MSYEKVKQLICEQLGKSADKITMDTKIVEDLGADSLDVVELLMGLEDEFGLSLPDEVAMQMKTVGDIVNYIDANVKK